MALFKIHKGTGAFPDKAVEGYCYFNSSTGRFAIDIASVAKGATMGTHRLLINPDAIVSISRSGNTFNATRADGEIVTFTQTDTKNTAGSTDSSSKLFLIGATSQATNPTTYSHDTAYIGTDGCLYSNNTKVSVEGHTHSYVPTSRTVNGKALSANITLSASDVGAAKASHGTHVTTATVKSALGTGTGTTKFLREDGSWATPAYYTLTKAKVEAVLTGNITTHTHSTYAAASHGTHVTTATVKSALGTGSGTTKFLREDGSWATPAYYTLSKAKVEAVLTGAITSHTHNYIPSNGTHAETASGTTANSPQAGMLYANGLYMTQTYSDSAMPCNYGNVINVAGAGTGQLLLEWSGSDNTAGRIFYRSHRDTATGGWSTWRQVWQAGDSVTGAVWNDYAEYRESDCEEFGRVLMENGDDTLSITTDRLQPFAGISSDTWGFCQGETEKAKTPIAVAGRVLAYPYQNRDNYKPGDCVCSAPNGTVDIMTREEVVMYPDRIIGTVSCVPNYETWGSGDRDPVQVNGRIWIKVK